MNCANCNSPVPNGNRFCGRCGAEVDIEFQCPHCGRILENGVLFCPGCKSAVSVDKVSDDEQVFAYDSADDPDTISIEEKDDKEITMAIPILRPDKYARISEIETGDMLSKPATGAVGIKASSGVSKPSAPARAKKKSNGWKEPANSDKQRNILVFVIVFLAIILSGLIGMIVYMNVSAPKNVDVAVDAPITGTVPEEDIEEAAAENPNEEADEAETSLQESGSSSTVELYDPKIQLNYAFATGKVFDEAIPREYTTYENYKYAIQCKVPSAFRHQSDGDVEVRYAAKDTTAYMDIGAMENTVGWSLDDVKDATVEQLGRPHEYHSDGESWFEVSATVNGISYYRKCYVDDAFVRYFELVYPSEYAQVYKDVVSDIKVKFVLTR